MSTNIEHIARELIGTEESFVRSLTVLMDVFVKPLQAARLSGNHILPKPEFDSIFMNVDDIHVIHTNLLGKMQANTDGHAGLGRILAENAWTFKNSHMKYATGFADSMSALSESLQKHVVFREFVEEGCRDLRCRGSRLESLLVQPIQRGPRYRLLLEALQKSHTNNASNGSQNGAGGVGESDLSDSDSLIINDALAVMSSALGAIDEEVRRQQDAGRVGRVSTRVAQEAREARMRTHRWQLACAVFFVVLAFGIVNFGSLSSAMQCTATPQATQSQATTQTPSILDEPSVASPILEYIGANAEVDNSETLLLDDSEAKQRHSLAANWVSLTHRERCDALITALKHGDFTAKLWSLTLFVGEYSVDGMLASTKVDRDARLDLVRRNKAFHSFPLIRRVCTFAAQMADSIDKADSLANLSEDERERQSALLEAAFGAVDVLLTVPENRGVVNDVLNNWIESTETDTASAPKPSGALSKLAERVLAWKTNAKKMSVRKVLPRVVAQLKRIRKSIIRKL